MKSLLLCLSLTLIGACGSTGTDTTPPAESGTVVNRLEQAGEVTYKLYLQTEANAGTRKGIVLLGAGNDENNPSTGSLEGGLENLTALELAKRGYVTAVVAYRDQPALVENDNGDSWNSNTAMLATDMSNVANDIITKVGGGLSRDRVLTGGVSYTSYALLTNIAMNDTPLADTRGVLAACGATGEFDAQNFKLPIFSVNCAGNPEGDFNGAALHDKITDQAIKADSGFFTDNSCNSHCGGSVDVWSEKLVERTLTWLP